MVMRKSMAKKPNCHKPSKCCEYRDCSHIDCSKILCEFHKLMKEAEECFESSQDEQNKVLCTLLQCLLDLDESMEDYERGKHLSIKAERLLDCSPCCFECNRDSCKCRELRREAIRGYTCYEKDMLEVICMLKKLIVSLKYSINAADEATGIYEKYLECVHGCNDKCKKDC
ncbi:MAG: hypothetical protein RR840_02800 [Clostridium sp.]